MADDILWIPDFDGHFWGFCMFIIAAYNLKICLSVGQTNQNQPK